MLWEYNHLLLYARKAKNNAVFCFIPCISTNDIRRLDIGTVEPYAAAFDAQFILNLPLNEAFEN